MPETPPQKKFYLTTPIYYVNARPHIGHAYTSIAADVLARRRRLLGDDTFFLTGTDEHGQKIERSAFAAGVPPQEFADQVAASFRALWDRMGITYDDFIRTTEARHKAGVQRLFRLLQERGAIYKGTYTGQYCVSDEAYVEGPPGIHCPDCGRLTETVSEENYYFRLSEYQGKLLDLIESNQLLITPDSRRNEVLSFIRGNSIERERWPELWKDLPDGTSQTYGPSSKDLHLRLASGQLKNSALNYAYTPGTLKDLSISRTSFHWGIPVPGDEKHVIYVWLDALANYMTAVGYGSDDPDDARDFARYWPADLHLVGKEIIRFHCVYWPAFLLAAGLPLPKAVTAHGWLLFEESKMSKSRGNIVRTETILDAFGGHYRSAILAYNEAELKKDAGYQPVPEPNKNERDLFASDVLRYFLLREIPFGQDGSFSFDAMITRYNADLANGYGNLVKRTLSMIEKDCGSQIPLHLERQTLSIALFEIRSGVKRYHPLIAVPDIEMARLATVMIFFEREASLSARFSLALDKAKLLQDLRDAAELEREERGALDYVNLLIAQTDLFISLEQPWKLAKSESPEDRAKLGDVLYTAAEAIRIITVLLYPFLPFATARVWKQLGFRKTIEQAAADGELNNLEWGGLKPGTKLGPLSPIFPRADKGLAQTMADMESPSSSQTSSTPTPENLSTVTADNDARTSERTEFAEARMSDAGPNADTAARVAPAPSRLSNETTTASVAVPLDPTHPAAGPRTSALPEVDPIAHVAGSAAITTERPPAPSHTEAQASGPFATAASSQPITSAPGPVPPLEAAAPTITIDDFAKVEMRVGKVVVAERIPKADKLLRLEVDLGTEPGLGRRQILSGIAEWYAPEDLLGRRIVVITNLAPRKMRGLESHGMLLAASGPDGGKPALATFAEMDEIPLGSRLK